eukprot:ctg_809.g396
MGVYRAVAGGRAGGISQVVRAVDVLAGRGRAGDGGGDRVAGAHAIRVYGAGGMGGGTESSDGGVTRAVGDAAAGGAVGGGGGGGAGVGGAWGAADGAPMGDAAERAHPA